MVTKPDLSMNDQELLQLLIQQEISLRSLDILPVVRAAKIRRSYLQHKKKIDLDNLSLFSFNDVSKNIEHCIGAVQVPIGVAGPLQISGEFAKGAYFIPLATTEGALVASVNRGCKIISLSGGAHTLLYQEGQTRSLLMECSSLDKVKQFTQWVHEHKQTLFKIGQSDESFLTLLDIELIPRGLQVWLRIIGNTHDAMGMNMITIAGKKMGQYIAKNLDYVKFIAESGNLCVDKKPSAMNLICGRGRSVIANVHIPHDLLEQELGISSQQLFDMNYKKNILGSAVAGAQGFNAHAANMIAALFIATGQDAAHVVDGSHTITTADLTSTGIAISVTLPDIQVGTVGGGTGLPSQKTCLSLLDCAGPGEIPGKHAKKLAEITAATVLAGELSLLAALCKQDLAKAHQLLNR